MKIELYVKYTGNLPPVVRVGQHDTLEEFNSITPKAEIS